MMLLKLVLILFFPASGNCTEDAKQAVDKLRRLGIHQTDTIDLIHSEKSYSGYQALHTVPGPCRQIQGFRKFLNSFLMIFVA